MSTVERIVLALLGVVVFSIFWESRSSADVINALSGGGEKILKSIRAQ